MGQFINEKKKKTGVGTVRKEYSKLRRDTVKAIRKGSKDHYRTESAKIKLLPAKKRKAARDALRKKVKQRKDRLIAKLPTATGMALRDLNRVLRIAKSLRW